MNQSFRKVNFFAKYLLFGKGPKEIERKFGCSSVLVVELTLTFIMHESNVSITSWMDESSSDESLCSSY